MEYRNKLILILALSNFFSEKNQKLKDKFLLLDPLIYNILYTKTSLKSDELKTILKEFNFEINIVSSFLEYLKSNNLVKYNISNDTFTLSDDIEETSKLNDIIIKSTSLWEDFERDIKIIISENKLKNLNILNINESIFNLFYNLFYEKNIEWNDIDLLIEHIKKIYGEENKFFLVFEKIINGIAIINSFSYSKNKENNKYLIYLDNVFVCNLLGWTDNIRHKNSISIINYLINNKYNIKIHKETLELICDKIKSYLSAIRKNKNIIIGTLYYYLKFQDCSNDYLNIHNIKNSIIEKLKYYNVFLESENIYEKPYCDDIYKEIERIRKEMYENKFGLENGEIDLAPSQEQTNYDYIIVKHYSKKLKELSNNKSINEIFLTYQKAIFQPFPCEQNEYIYIPLLCL